MPALPFPVRVPRTKLWGNADDGYLIVLECICGFAVPYPGHPDDTAEVACERCSTRYVVAPVGRVAAQGA